MIKSLIMLAIWMLLIFVSYKFIRLNISEMQKRDDEKNHPRSYLYEKPEDD